MSSDEQALVALTMAPEAAERFLAALLYAAARIPQSAVMSVDDPMAHADWLMWGASRLGAARRALSEHGVGALGHGYTNACTDFCNNGQCRLDLNHDQCAEECSAEVRP